MKFDSTLRFAAASLLGFSLFACTATQQTLPSKPLQIVAIDVEGGAAILYVTPEGKSLLVDTGWPPGRGGRRPANAAPNAQPSPVVSSADKIIAAARKAGVNKLDYVLITHYHVDHVGGLGELISKFPVETILDHGPNREVLDPNSRTPVAMQPASLYVEYERTIAGHQRQSLKTGDKVQLGSVMLTAAISDGEVPKTPPPEAGQAIAECASMTEKADNGGEENERSLGILLTYGKARVVALGDLTWNMEKKLVCPISKIGRTDVMIVSEHGTNRANSPALLRALMPRLAITNNGAQKGGDPQTYDNVSALPGLQRLWQLHFAIKGELAHNPPAAYIANVTDDPDQYAALFISVFPDGRLSVLNERTGFSESYPAPETSRP